MRRTPADLYRILDWLLTVYTASKKTFVPQQNTHFFDFYRAMHYSAKRGIAIACRDVVRPSVCNVGRSGPQVGTLGN